jgi:chitin-binding protein
MKRKTRMGTGAAATAAVLIGTGVITSAPASAHGYVEGPLSRSAACNIGLNTDCGSIVYEPQSLEALKGFPEAGPADGQIASAGGLFGGVLDEQTADRWYKNEITTGPLLMDWKYTAPHSTAKWHYYMTKQGWDPNAPLTRADLELIAEVQHDGSKAITNPDHTISVPQDRSGYHVILAVWDIEDTVNAFYNVIDVNVVGEGTPDTEPPSVPMGLDEVAVSSNSVTLDWSDSYDDAGAVTYVIYRNGQKIGTSSASDFVDLDVLANTTYDYTVVATDLAGNTSNSSMVLTAVTDPIPVVDDVPPSVPQYLHTMGVSQDSVQLMWESSTDDGSSVEYVVFRDGVQIARTAMTMLTDGGLAPSTSYNYSVRAIDASGNISDASNGLLITTETVAQPDPQPQPQPEPSPGGSWNASASYAAGDVVTYGGATYRAVQSHTGVGDPNWITAPSLWQIVDEAVAPEPTPEPTPEPSEVGAWSATGAYAVGDRVVFNGSVYEAVQSHTGVGDPNWIYAPSLWKQI